MENNYPRNCARDTKRKPGDRIEFCQELRQLTSPLAVGLFLNFVPDLNGCGNLGPKKNRRILDVFVRGRFFNCGIDILFYSHQSFVLLSEFFVMFLELFNSSFQFRASSSNIRLLFLLRIICGLAAAECSEQTIHFWLVERGGLCRLGF